MKKLYNKSPVLWGILFGQGLFLLFILFEFVVFEFWLVNSGIGVIVDSCIRVVFGVIALLFMRIIYGDKFGKLFTAKIPKSTWLYCKTNEMLQPSCPNSKLIEGKVFRSNVSKAELAEWEKEVSK